MRKSDAYLHGIRHAVVAIVIKLGEEIFTQLEGENYERYSHNGHI